MAGRPKIFRRKRFFVGCEGESEQGYAALLQMFANEEKLHVHIVAKVMTRAGDPLAMAERAVATIRQEERSSKPAFVDRFLQFDTDLIGQSPDRDANMARVAEGAGLNLIRQERCFESFLLRHFAGHEHDHPATSAEALNRLRAVWPEYKKGTSAHDLAKRIQLEDARRAAENPLNADFTVLLATLGLSAWIGSGAGWGSLTKIVKASEYLPSPLDKRIKGLKAL